MKRFSLYGCISATSFFIRMFLLPNPFECFGAEGEIYNWIAEFVIHAISYGLVGLVYCKGSFPAYGSFLYLLTYSIFVGILWIFGIFSFAWWWILSLVVGAPLIICLFVFIIRAIIIKIGNKKNIKTSKN